MDHFFQTYIPKDTLLQDIVCEYFSRVGQFNFTGHKTEETFFVLNVLDSILPLKDEILDIQPGMKVADLGTGGGFPGMPLAALLPESTFTLFDSVEKKLKLINEVATQYKMKNVRTVHCRLEEAGQSKHHREQYDVVISKALAKWTTLLEYALPFVKPGGVFYAYQGEEAIQDAENSRDIAKLLGASVENVSEYTLPHDFGKRYILALKKNSSTPALYPRNVGMPKEQPLS